MISNPIISQDAGTASCSAGLSITSLGLSLGLKLGVCLKLGVWSLKLSSSLELRIWCLPPACGPWAYFGAPDSVGPANC